jgi:hypothetical protein
MVAIGIMTCRYVFRGFDASSIVAQYQLVMKNVVLRNEFRANPGLSSRRFGTTKKASQRAPFSGRSPVSSCALRGVKTANHAGAAALEERFCPENTQWFPGKGAAVPTADNPDF